MYFNPKTNPISRGLTGAFLGTRGPLINHVEARSRNIFPPRQYVSESHDHRPPAPTRTVREVNKMTIPLIPLAVKLGLIEAQP